jgi:tRNA A37 N6-isopentenylltransferase MiaA
MEEVNNQMEEVNNQMEEVNNQMEEVNNRKQMEEVNNRKQMEEVYNLMEEVNKTKITKSNIFDVRNVIRGDMANLKRNSAPLTKQEKKEAKDYDLHLYHQHVAEYTEHIDEQGNTIRREKLYETLCEEVYHLVKNIHNKPVHLQLVEYKYLLFILSGKADVDDILTKVIVIYYKK